MAGVGHYVPERVMTNADFEKILDTTDEWIVSRTGMHERHIAREDETTSDMGLAAAKMAIDPRRLRGLEHRLRDRRNGHPRLSLSRHGQRSGCEARNQGHGRIRYRDRVQRFHLRAHRRVEPDSIGRLQARAARGQREALLDHQLRGSRHRSALWRRRRCGCARSGGAQRFSRVRPRQRRQRSVAAARSGGRNGGAADRGRHRCGFEQDGHEGP